MKLVGTDGTRLYSFDLGPGKHELGRSAEIEFCVPDRTVSRRHATIEVSTSGIEVFIIDEGSHNGTTINSTRVTDRKQIRPGDRVSFGQVEFRLKEADATRAPMSRPTSAVLADHDVEKSMVMSVNEVLKAMPMRVTQRPELFPTLAEMARMLHLSEPQEVMLERSLELVNKVIPAGRLAVLLSQPDSDELYVAATLLPGGKDPGSFNLSKTIIGEILTNKSAMVVGDPMNDPRFAEQKSIIMSQMHSAMAVPLFDEDSVLGILYVDTTNPAHRYDDEYLSLLATFGNILASRLLSYSLLNEREERRVYEAELSRASNIQENLLTRDLPELKGYQVKAIQQQCRAVGGDLYDVAVLPNGKLVLIVADVSGKGMGAALLMANILASFRILYNVTEFTLKEVVLMVSHQLFVSSGASDFATMFIGVIDPATHKMEYINAGHNPPVVARANGDHDHLQACGTMIGAFDMDTWTVEETSLAPDDMILVYTDGVTEADRGDEQYGEKRLEDLLMKCCRQPLTEMLDTIMGDIDRFLGDAPRSDDITILSVKRTD